MKNIKNNKIIYSLGILAILAFTFVAMPGNAKAERPGYVTPYSRPLLNQSSYTISNDNPDGSYYADTTANNYYNNINTTSQNTTTKSKTVEKTNTTTSTDNKNTSSSESVGNLAANAIFGSNGYAPSGLIQWVLFAILILLIVILVRKLTGAGDRYQNEPLKHA